MSENRGKMVIRMGIPSLVGKCHICKEMDKPICYCGKCKHWFCEGCRKDYFHRGIEAIKELIGGPSPGCCGVTDGIEHAEQ